MADDRDAYAYYRVAEVLGLDWDFSDPNSTLELASWLSTLDDAICGGLERSSWGALGCTCKALAEQSCRNLELEYEAAWLHSVGALIQAGEFHDCAAVLEAAAAVVDYQLSSSIAMTVAAFCGNGSVLRALASALRVFADTVAEHASPCE